MKDTIVIYHAHCADGVAAAWAAWLMLREKAEYIPGYYGMDLPEVQDKTVYLVDFSFKRHDLHKMSEQAKKIIVLDHHISAIQDLQGVDLFRNNVDISHCTVEKSGCQITWDFFHSHPRPALLDIVADRDLWKFNNPNTKSIMAHVMSYKLTIEKFDELCDEYDTWGEASFAMSGNAILRAQKKHVESVRKNLTFIEFHQFPNMPTVNTNGMFASDLGNLISFEFDVALLYYIDKDSIKFSMRSSPDGPDVSKICEHFGGGGHKNAAGFTLKLTDIRAKVFFNKLAEASTEIK